MQQTEFEYHISYMGFGCSSTGYFVPYRRSQVGASSYHFAIFDYYSPTTSSSSTPMASRTQYPASRMSIERPEPLACHLEDLFALEQVQACNPFEFFSPARLLSAPAPR